MPAPSDQLRYILGDESHGWEILIRARQMEAAGDPPLNLCVGEHDEPTPPEIIAEMERAASAGHTGYAGLEGTPGLRRAIAERVSARAGRPCGPQNVLVTAGGQAALNFAFRATLDPGDVAVAIDPYYATYPGTIRTAGGVARFAPARAANGFEPDFDTLDAACDGARALLVNTPNNPTGAVYSDDTLAMIAEICIRRDLWLISDEVYDGMAFGRPHRSPAALPGMAERTLIVGSMSKSYAMCGFRCGWLAGPEAVVEGLFALALNTAFGLPGFIMDAAELALGRPEIEARICGTFQRRHGVARRALAGAQAARAGASDGAMYVMIDIRPTGLSGRDFAHLLLEEERIAVTPGESFGAEGAGHVRAALTLPDGRLERALRRLGEVADEIAAGRRSAPAA